MPHHLTLIDVGGLSLLAIAPVPYSVGCVETMTRMTDRGFAEFDPAERVWRLTELGAEVVNADTRYFGRPVTTKPPSDL